jgi:hypothetical protein
LESDRCSKRIDPAAVMKVCDKCLDKENLQT